MRNAEYKRRYRALNAEKLRAQERVLYQKNKKKCLDCENMINAKAERCVPCASKVKHYVIPCPKPGALNPAWVGGRVKHAAGYIRKYCPEHPNRDKDNYVLEHRWVVEQNLGRYLLEEEVVHHINGKKDDNRVENLELMTSQSAHATLHFPELEKDEHGKFLPKKKVSQ